MPAFSSNDSWLEGVEVRVELPGVRWPWFVCAAVLLLGVWLVLLSRRSRRWVAPAVGAGVLVIAFGGAHFELPSCDVLKAVPTARAGARLLFATRYLGAALAALSAIGALVWFASRDRSLASGEALVCALGVVTGFGVAWAETAPVERLSDLVVAAGRLPAPMFRHAIEAQVGLPVERAPSVVHWLIQDYPRTPFLAGWDEERPRRIVPTKSGHHEQKLGYTRGPVRITVPVSVYGVEDRGPRAWPFAVGDELRLREGGTWRADIAIRVLSAKEVNGYRVHEVEVVTDGGAPVIQHVVRKDGGLYRTEPSKRTREGEFSFEEFLVEKAPGKCKFDHIECACAPRLTRCSATYEGTEGGRFAAQLLWVAMLGQGSGTTLGKTTTTELVVVSHTGPGAP